MTKIFISYRRDDSADIAGRIYDRLIAKFGRENVFKDVDSIPFGVNFKKHLEGVVQQCAVELVLIGKQWLDITDENGQRRLDNPRDFVRIEIESALARDIPVIPLLVSGASMPDDSKVPPSLVELTYRNGTAVRRDPDFHTDMDRLIASIEQWLAESAPTAAPPKQKFTLPLLEWINIPAGKVMLEQNAGTYTVEAFAIAKYPVTNAQFQAFIDDHGYRQSRYWKDLAKRETSPEASKWSGSTHPRETVNWYEAIAFTRWLSDKTGLTVTLPTEMQWQWAAVGDTGWEYPYGSKFDRDKANNLESGLWKTTHVDKYPQGASPFGVEDMVGNVWEWCLNEYAAPQNTHINSSEQRVIRGGAANLDQYHALAVSRTANDPDYRDVLIGFRVAVTHPVTE